jgi:hypothetical protein
LRRAAAEDYDPDRTGKAGAFPGVWYRIAVDHNGNYLHGDGDGWGWYYYPASNTYRMWFYNGPYDPDRRGIWTTRFTRKRSIGVG